MNKSTNTSQTTLLVVIFTTLLVTTTLSLYSIQTLVLNKSNIYNALSQTITAKALSTVTIREMPIWMLSLFTFQMVAIRSFAITICIIIGLYVANIEFKFWNIIKLTIAAQFIFVLQYFAELIWFLFISKTVTAEVLEQYNPFSFASILSIGNTQEWYYIILDKVNLFDIAFILFLPLLLNGIVNKTYLKNLLFVVATYGFGFLTWLLLVTLHSLF